MCNPRKGSGHPSKAHKQPPTPPNLAAAPQASTSHHHSARLACAACCVHTPPCAVPRRCARSLPHHPPTQTQQLLRVELHGHRRTCRTATHSSPQQSERVFKTRKGSSSSPWLPRARQPSCQQQPPCPHRCQCLDRRKHQHRIQNPSRGVKLLSEVQGDNCTWHFRRREAQVGEFWELEGGQCSPLARTICE